MYAAETRSLCILERLVHLVRLPREEAFTRILIPDSIRCCEVAASELTADWNDPVESPITQTIAFDAMARHNAAVALVPSVIVPGERCIIIDPEHSAFPEIQFGEPAPFSYDGRLIRQST